MNFQQDGLTQRDALAGIGGLNFTQATPRPPAISSRAGKGEFAVCA